MTLEERKALAKERGRIDNGDLPAGAPMYYYCRHCGLQSDVLPENWVDKPPHFQVCEECADEGLE